uniref:Small integral membrane protein 8 n=1 Tax=Arion vulgaris TaxID=1028688 RepID=A0A0B6ZIQ3_9EUPU
MADTSSSNNLKLSNKAADLGIGHNGGGSTTNPTGTAEHQTETHKSKPTAKPNPAVSTGWASMGSTSAFRAINFELFVKPNKFVMAFGVIAFTSCLSYIVYMNVTDDKRRSTYVTLDEDGGTTRRQKTSRWY